MPNELNIALKTGLTVTAQRYQAGAAVGSAINLSEVGTSGFYSGDMTGSAGTYQLTFRSAGANVGSGSIVWDGTAEVASSAPTVVQIRTELDSNSTKLANLDATISSRSNLTTGDLPSVPSAASVASAVRSELTSELSNLDASISSRLAGSAYTAPSTPPTTGDIASAVWAAADKTGYSLTSAERTAIATAVESSILNEGDGQAVLNAIVAAIGNSNVDQIALVAAIRADLERTGGKLINLDATISSRLAATDYNAPTSAPTAASVANAVWSAATRTTTGGTVDTLTNAPASVTPADIWDYNARTLTSASGPTAIEIRQEIDSNSTQLSGIKSKTDNLPASPAATSDIPSANISAIKAKTDLLETTRLAQCSTVATTGAQLAAALS
jgi:hypothetical protein